MRRMVWVRRGGRWHGKWAWEAYDRDEEWDKIHEFNRQWLSMGNIHQSTIVPGRGVDVPMEVLRYMLKAFDWVRVVVSSTIDRSHC